MIDQALIQQALAQKATDYRRAVKVLWQGDLYWLKHPGRQKAPSHLRRRLQWMLSALMRMPILRPTVRDGSIGDLKQEKARLQEWRQLHLPAPEILAEGEDWFLMPNSGDMLTRVLPALSPEEQDKLLHQTLDALLYIHKTGTCHGRPMIKDILATKDGALTFVDFEENPLDVMHLPDAQARDILIFLSSVSNYAALPSLARKAVEQSHPKTVQVLEKALRILGFLKKPLAFVGRLKPATGIPNILRTIESLDSSIKNRIGPPDFSA